MNKIAENFLSDLQAQISILIKFSKNCKLMIIF